MRPCPRKAEHGEPSSTKRDARQVAGLASLRLGAGFLATVFGLAGFATSASPPAGLSAGLAAGFAATRLDAGFGSPLASLPASLASAAASGFFAATRDRLPRARAPCLSASA